MTSRIRDFVDDDIPAIGVLIRSILAEFKFTHDVGGLRRDLERMSERYRRPRSGLWVAVRAFEGEERLVGTVGIRPKDERTCELKRLYVDPAERGIGLGQQLYEHAERFARATGYERIWLDSSNRFTKARRLYERNGFMLLEAVDNDWQDAIFEKILAIGGHEA